ncbi:hypothetical protein HYV50_02790 [Candidatus Pacearchaeota archaeon]|nr:hypothetical protein [Candidatus Pacearchaeota archaeon]
MKHKEPKVALCLDAQELKILGITIDDLILSDDQLLCHKNLTGSFPP